MLLNEIKVALRNIRSSLLYTSINITGLALGIAASILITLYVIDEISFDAFHKQADNIYRVGLRAKISGQEVAAAATCPPMAQTVQDEFPEVQQVIRLAQWQETVVSYSDKAFTERNVLLADSNFFSFFSFNLLEGDPATALADMNKVVLTESIVKKYFGDQGSAESVLGKIMEIGNGKLLCMVTGIVEDAPKNSHIPYDMIVSLSSWEASKKLTWINNFLYNYIKLNPDADPVLVELKFADLVEKYVGPEAAEALGMDPAESGDDDFYYGYFLTPIKDIHLHSKLVAELKPTGDIKQIYIFSTIAIFILTLAIINFINLSTARGGRRAKEVGVRKTAGALRGQLIMQFLIESITQAFFAMLLAGLLIHLLIDTFNQVAQKNLSFNVLVDPWIIAFMLLLTLMVGLLAGIYPSLYLTSFKPIEILRGSWGGAKKSATIRSALVVFQFAISIFMITSTVLIYKQLRFIQKQDLGFSDDAVLVINNASMLDKNKNVFRKELSSYIGIKDVSISTHLPPNVTNSSIFRPDGEGKDHLLNYYWTDQNHLNTLNIQMLQGRFYSKDYPSDSNALIINEVAFERFNWDSFEGHKILSFDRGDNGVMREVIGVVKDFNFAPLREDIQPMAIILGDFGNLISVKFESDNYTELLESVKSKWKELSNGAPFDYYFLDDEFDTIYRTENQLGKIFLAFTILAIVIACLGLFGLASFTAEQKTREIGIRKVLGASIPNVVFSLTKNFMKLVLLAVIIGMPIAYILMSKWLEGFAYKTGFGVWIFVLTGLLVLIISSFTVGSQAINAALCKPSDALKAE